MYILHTSYSPKLKLLFILEQNKKKNKELMCGKNSLSFAKFILIYHVVLFNEQSFSDHFVDLTRKFLRVV